MNIEHLSPEKKIDLILEAVGLILELLVSEEPDEDDDLEHMDTLGGRQ